jgi:hypothetical protein
VPWPMHRLITLLFPFLLMTVISCGCRTSARTPAPPASPSAMRPVRDVITAHSAELMALPGVVGLYEGETSRHQPCIRIMVAERTHDLVARLPQHLEGYPVEIEESGTIHPMRDSS